MGVIFNSDYTLAEIKTIKELTSEVIKINEKLDELLKKENHQEKSYINEKTGFAVFNKGKMFWWKKVEDAVRYIITVSISGNIIDTVDVEKTKCYHTFTDLVENSYSLVFQAEDRRGNIIQEIEFEAVL